MVSGKERLRLERQWNEMKERMDRQYQAITRLAALNTHLAAALLEIKNSTPGVDFAASDAINIATVALDAAEQMARAANEADSGKDEDQQD